MEAIVMKMDQKTQSEVVDVLNRAHDAYRRRDIDELLGYFAPDTDVVMYGTGADEKRIGRDAIRQQAERDWAQTESSAFDWNWHSVVGSENVACLSADGAATVTIEGENINMPIRFTGVLEKQGDKWLFVQAHYSVPFGEQAEGESWPGQ
jgi:ketosteroid isomerase-like protein